MFEVQRIDRGLNTFNLELLFYTLKCSFTTLSESSWIWPEWTKRPRFTLWKELSETVDKFEEAAKSLVERFLKREWDVKDGLPEEDLVQAERRLSVELPLAMRSFYAYVGAVSELCSIHNVILHPRDLAFEEGWLMFMEENQSVVSWGIRKEDLRATDPVTWQRNNASNDWYSEEKSFTELMISMFEWYRELGVWNLSARNSDHILNSRNLDH